MLTLITFCIAFIMIMLLVSKGLDKALARYNPKPKESPRILKKGLIAYDKTGRVIYHKF